MQMLFFQLLRVITSKEGPWSKSREAQREENNPCDGRRLGFLLHASLHSCSQQNLDMTPLTRFTYREHNPKFSNCGHSMLLYSASVVNAPDRIQASINPPSLPIKHVQLSVSCCTLSLPNVPFSTAASIILFPLIMDVVQMTIFLRPNDS